MATQATIIESQREGAEVYIGAEQCKQKCMELLEEVHLPRGLLPLSEMEEVGYNRSTGFVWLRQKKKTEHYFKRIGKNVSYAAEVTAFVEDRRMRKLTGVKAKELLLWITITEMGIEDPTTKKIIFRTTAGLGRSFPASAFDLEEELKKEGEN